ncbi:MAG: ABC transporter ATP-binding protein [Armatimonadota bacterium]|nr:ABC transporter ATP-binding protein [Armatimonadota bacterium]MDR5696404.1 ABC transporter ATP-binding protein [Armatimonadota bacterium]
MSPTPLLSAEGLLIRFGGLTALDGVSLEVNRGEVVAIIGPNGSGKTTLFNVVMGIYPPHRGRVALKGEDVTGLPAHQVVQRGVARTFQVSRLFLDLSVLDNVMLGCVGPLRTRWSDLLMSPRVSERRLREVAERAAALLEEVSPDLRRRCYRAARELTLAERRRLELCRALASDPELLLLDEPSAGLDVRETQALMDEVSGLRGHRPNLGVALIEHDMAVVRGLAERVVALNYGRKIAEGSFEEVAASPEVREAYLGA